MKKILYLIALIIIVGYTAEAKPANPPAGFGIFFSTLNPHGVWMEMGDGLVVWRPTIIRRGWAPYREGQWIWTEDGWYWDSYEPFGHVTYHYGRWHYDDYYGWIWVPDYEWAPAWVEWRYDDVYIGWAPLPPYAVFSINIGIHFTHDYYTPYHHYHFVDYRWFDDPYVYRHFVGHNYKNKIYSRTKYRTNYGYYDGRVVNRGVDVDYVRKRSGRDFKTREIERVRDYNQFAGSRDRGGDNGKVRTLYVPKDELRKERNINSDVIKRTDRKTSLDASRVEIGERRERGNQDRNRETVKREEKNTPVVRETKGTEVRNRTDVQTGRTETGKQRSTVQEKRKDNNTGNVREKQDVNVNRGNLRNTEINKRAPQENVDRTRQQKKEAPVVTGRSNQNERMNRTEVRTPNTNRNKPEVRTQTDNERKPEVRTNTNRNRTEVRNQSNTNQKREVKAPETKVEKRNETRVERNNSGNERSKTKNRTR